MPGPLWGMCNMGEIYANAPDEVIREVSKLVHLSGLLRAAGDQRADEESYKAAVRAYDKALRQTVDYMDRVDNKGEPFSYEKEFELSTLWSEASVAISAFDPALAKRCFIKGQGWLNPAVWHDKRYARYKIGIDDMREALMDLYERRYASTQSQVPSWFPVAGVIFTAATFLSLFALLLLPDLSDQKRMIFNAWVALCIAASAAFLGGSAVAKGTLRIPLMKDAPVIFSAVGGVATFIVVFLIMTAANR
jgi:hypothetical protein